MRSDRRGILARVTLACLFACLCLIPAADASVVIDDFDDGADPNALGGSGFVLHEQKLGSSISYEYTSDAALRYGDRGRSLRINYDVVWPKGWCAWGTDLKNLQAHGYSRIWMRFKGSNPLAESFTVFLKDRLGNLHTAWTGSLPSKFDKGWLEVNIPIERKRPDEFLELESLMIMFDSIDGKGYLLIDEIRLEDGVEVEPPAEPQTTPVEPTPQPLPEPLVEAPAETIPQIAEAPKITEPGPEPIAPRIPAPKIMPHVIAPPRLVVQAPPPKTREVSIPKPPPPQTFAIAPTHILKKQETVPTAPAPQKPLAIAPTQVLKKQDTPPGATVAPAAPKSLAIAPTQVLQKKDMKPEGPTGDGYVILDAMDNPKNWGIEGEEGTTLNFKTVDGVKGKALGLDYAYGKGFWVQIRSPQPAVDLTRIEAIRLRMKVVKGTANVEIKITDDDWSTFGKKFEEVEPENAWVDLIIPIEEFTYWWGGDSKLDLKKVRAIFIAITKLADPDGEIHLDQLEYKLRPAAMAEAGPGDKVIIDSFERSVPENAYSPVFGDKSEVDLESVRESHDGDYSMRINYTLETTRSLATYAGAISAFSTPLDWTGVDAFKIWVRGDGSSNQFRVNIVDRDEEVWSYTDRHVLKANKWQLVSVPMGQFKIPTDILPRNRRLDADEIQRVEILVIGDRTDKTTGTFWVDEMYVTGKNMERDRVSPAELRRGLVVPIPVSGASFNFGLVNFAEFVDVPEESQKVNHYGKFLIDAQISKYSARLEFASDAQDYGSSTYFDTQGALNSDNPRTVLVNSQINVKEPISNMRLLTLGYLWIDFGRWAFTPQFGNKGLKAEGGFGQLAYEGFLIKKRYDAFATGARFTLPHNSWLFQGILVFDNDYAQQTAAVLSGSLLATASSTRIKTQPISRDMVATFEAIRKLHKDRITISTLLGRNINSQYGTKSGTYSPTVVTLYDNPLQTAGNLGIAEIKTNDYPWKRLSLNTQVRWIGTHFKPSFREGGVTFDDVWSDQKGVNLRIVQAIWKWSFAGEYDHLRRLSNTLYDRSRKKMTVGYYGIRNIDLAATGEFFDEVYRFSSIRSAFTADKNEKKFSAELHVGLMISDKLRMWAKGIEERVSQPANNNAQFKTDIFHTRLEYYISNNARVFMENKFTQFGNPAWEPIGSPFSDNFTKFTAELNF